MRIVTKLLILSLLLFPAGAVMALDEAADDRIYDQVRIRLANHPDVKGAAIEVKVEDGVVTLAGKVRTEKARLKAESVAGKVKGVKKVVNQLLVTPT